MNLIVKWIYIFGHFQGSISSRLQVLKNETLFYGSSLLSSRNSISIFFYEVDYIDYIINFLNYRIYGTIIFLLYTNTSFII